MELRYLVSAVALMTSLAHAEADGEAFPLATFDTPGSLAEWHVSGSGSLRLGTGYRGSGAVLTYSVERQAPVVVTWRPSAPVPKVQSPAVSLWVRFSGDVEVTLKTDDTAGNTLLTPIAPSLEHSQHGEWLYTVCTLKKRIASLALIIRSRTDTAVQGDLSYDEVRLSSGKSIFRLTQDGKTQEPPSKARDLAIMGVNIHLLRDVPSLDLARAAGFRFVRMDLLWTNIERRGRFRFFAYDRLVQELEARGMGVLWILDYGHPDHGGPVPRTAEDRAAFSRFAEAAATHFHGRNVRYEIWNEPNNPQFWAPSPNPAEYAALLKETVAAMRRADPSAVISSGGISNLDLPYLSQTLDRSLVPGLSAVSVHPYPRDRPEGIVPAYAAIRSWLANNLGGTLEMWDSEWGYSSTLSGSGSALNGHSERDRQRQATLAVREVLTVWSLGFSLGVWYDLRDDGDNPANPEQNYGLLDSTGHEKPAMRAVRTLLQSVVPRHFAGMFPEPPPGFHAMRFDGSRDKLLIVWTESFEKNQTVEFVGDKLISATDMTGKALQTKSSPKGAVRIRISENTGPVYLLFRTASRT